MYDNPRQDSNKLRDTGIEAIMHLGKNAYRDAFPITKEIASEVGLGNI